MPNYGIPQSGFNQGANQGLNLTDLIPGESFVCFDGSESPAVNLASVAFNRGLAPAFTDQGITFYMNGAPPDMVIDVQGSNIDLNGDYVTLGQLGPQASGNDAYTDVGRAAFYRVKISTASSGSPAVMPKVTVQR